MHFREAYQYVLDMFGEKIEEPFFASYIADKRANSNLSEIAHIHSPDVSREAATDILLSYGPYVGSNFVTHAEPFKFVIFRSNASESEICGVVKFSLNCSGPMGHVHGGCLATLGDLIAAYAGKGGIMTRSLTVNYRTPVVLGSVVTFKSERPSQEELQELGLEKRSKVQYEFATRISFYDVRDELKFSVSAIFARPKTKSNL